MSLTAISAILLQATPAVPEPSQGINSAIWHWLIIISVAAFVIIYTLKRISDVVANRKTETMIRNVVGDDVKKDDGSPEIQNH